MVHTGNIYLNKAFPVVDPSGSLDGIIPALVLLFFAELVRLRKIMRRIVARTWATGDAKGDAAGHTGDHSPYRECQVSILCAPLM